MTVSTYKKSVSIDKISVLSIDKIFYIPKFSKLSVRAWSCDSHVKGNNLPNQKPPKTFRMNCRKYSSAYHLLPLSGSVRVNVRFRSLFMTSLSDIFFLYGKHTAVV